MMSIGLLLAAPALLTVGTCGRIAPAMPAGNAITVVTVSGAASVVLLLGFVTT